MTPLSGEHTCLLPSPEVKVSQLIGQAICPTRTLVGEQLVFQFRAGLCWV
ncbi:MULTISPECIES: hypothetical protein [Pseudomonas]|nr:MULTISPECIES: hypothetical protein [Pseudomonas]MBY8929821.1 hypothetical protein [Pseudomonas sp. Wu6]